MPSLQHPRRPARRSRLLPDPRTLPRLKTAAALGALLAGAATAQARATLHAITYDSFAAKGGLGAELQRLAKSTCQVNLGLHPAGDGVQVLNQIELGLKTGGTRPDLAVGIDTTLWDRARVLSEDWGAWRPKTFSKLLPSMPREPGFVPFDQGPMAWMADTEQLARRKLAMPRSLKDLLKPEYKQALLLEDPRTSTPGLGFVLWVDALMGPGAQATFAGLKPQWLTLTSGWDQAYGLFVKGQAPLVWSYLTSQAYHRMNDKDGGKRYQAVILEEGAPLQIEGAFWVRGAPKEHSKSIQCVLETLQGPELQRLVPTKNWMLPVVSGVKLPKAFEELPKPVKTQLLTPRAGSVAPLLERWRGWIGGAP